MKRVMTGMGIGLVVLLSATLTLAQMAPNAEEAGVRKALDAYLQGHATGQPKPFSKAMHPEMRMSFVRDGKLMHRTAAEYIAGAPGKPAADEASRKRRIVSIDITGTAAMAKLELDHPDALLTDYMLLLKVDGEWRIIAKTFDRQPPRTRGSASAR
jgi:hypothetical protein